MQEVFPCNKVLQGMNNNSTNAIKSIQLLRAVAAISVVYAHYAHYAFPSFATGAYGVDIFFIISGFIIAYIAGNNTENFLKNRFIRIIPLYAIATGIAILTIIISPQWVNNSSISFTAIAKSLLFIPYKINNSGPILSLGWSLNYEMFFYLVMAICIGFVPNKKYTSIACASLLVILTIILNFIYSENYIINFYQRGLFPEFIYGIVLYYIYNYYTLKAFRNKGAIINTPISLSIFTGIGISSFLFLFFSCIYHLHISDNSNIQVGLPALLLVFSVISLEKYINSNNVFIKTGLLLGDASYVMYLFHPFCIYFLQRIVFRAIGLQDNTFIGLIKLITALVITAAFSIYIYKWIDNPIQVLIRKWLLKKKV